MERLNFQKFQINQEVLEIAGQLTTKLSSNKDMVFQFLHQLKEMKIVAPGLSTIEDILCTALKGSEDKIYIKVLEQLQNRENLQVILETDEKGESLYTQLKNTSVNISSNGAKELLSKIKAIDELQCSCDLSFLSEEKVL